MRIALVTSTFPPLGSNGGLATFYYELALAFRRLGHEVLVVTLANGMSSEEWVEGIRIWRCSFSESDYASLQNLGFLSNFSWDFPRAAELYRQSVSIIEEFKPEVIECVESGFEGLFFALSQTVPIVVRCLCPQFHLLEIGYGQQTSQVDRHLVSALEFFVIGKANAVSAPSSSLARIISQGVGIPQDSIAIIRNPLMVSSVRQDSNLESLKNGSPSLLYSGRIEKLKGCDLLIEMLSLLVGEFPGIELVMVGSESQVAGETESFMTRLRREIDERGLASHVRLIGRVPRAKIHEFIARADLCLFPSRFDSSPYACLEAMSGGATVVATNVGGIPEYVEHGLTGWLVEPENPRALAESVSHLMRDPLLRRQLGDRARKSIQELCDSRKIAQQSLELYEQAVRAFRRFGNGSSNQALVAELLEALDALCRAENLSDFADRVMNHGDENFETLPLADDSVKGNLQGIRQPGVAWELVGKVIRYAKMMLRG